MASIAIWAQARSNQQGRAMATGRRAVRVEEGRGRPKRPTAADRTSRREWAKMCADCAITKLSDELARAIASPP